MKVIVDYDEYQALLDLAEDREPNLRMYRNTVLDEAQKKLHEMWLESLQAEKPGPSYVSMYAMLELMKR